MAQRPVITISAVLNSRYGDEPRPSSWDARREGKDMVVDTRGTNYTLVSTGQQSTPQPGWTIVLNEQSDAGAWSWTLYGMRPN